MASTVDRQLEPQRLNPEHDGNGARALRNAPIGVHYRPRARDDARERDGLATFLGLFSVGLGVAELVAPGSVARLIGVRDTPNNRTTLQAMGARELLSGIGILSQRRPSGWMWSRVAGDALDLSLLGAAMNDEATERSRTVAAAAAVAGVTALDIFSAMQLSDEMTPREARQFADDNYDSLLRDQQPAALKPVSGIKRAWHTVTVNKPREEVFAFWRNFENLPRFMKHLESVAVHDQKLSHWVAKAPAGTSVEWDAEIIDEREPEFISWRSLPDAVVPNAGTVRFKQAPGNRGTEVHVSFEYLIPGGAVGAAFAKLLGEEPELQVREDMRRFKQVLETGEVVISDASQHNGMHPAQPSK